METYCYFVIALFVLSAIGTYFVMRRTKPTPECQHKSKGTYIENTAATCETTKTTCLDCGKVLEHYTDCR